MGGEEDDDDLKDSFVDSVNVDEPSLRKRWEELGLSAAAGAAPHFTRAALLSTPAFSEGLFRGITACVCVVCVYAHARAELITRKTQKTTTTTKTTKTERAITVFNNQNEPTSQKNELTNSDDSRNNKNSRNNNNNNESNNKPPRVRSFLPSSPYVKNKIKIFLKKPAVKSDSFAWPSSKQVQQLLAEQKEVKTMMDQRGQNPVETMILSTLVQGLPVFSTKPQVGR